jgi:hypothetical protein
MQVFNYQYFTFRVTTTAEIVPNSYTNNDVCIWWCGVLFTIYILLKVVTFSYLLPNQPPVRVSEGN